jgi:hypothetical protein
MNLGDLGARLSELLSYLETERIRDLIYNLDERGFMYLGGGAALLVVLAILKKMFRTVTVILALCATIVLLHFTLPEAGQNIELRQLIGLFVGGAFIVSVSLYMLFIRSD